MSRMTYTSIKCTYQNQPVFITYESKLTHAWTTQVAWFTVLQVIRLVVFKM